MTHPKSILVKHMMRDGPWLSISTYKRVRDQKLYIESNSPERERPLRLKLIGIVKEPLPLELARTYAAVGKAYAAWTKAYAAWEKTDAVRVKVYAIRTKAYATWTKAYAARDKTKATWEKACAAWERAIVSPSGVTFHKKVCGCAWTPKQSDILIQLTQLDPGAG